MIGVPYVSLMRTQIDDATRAAIVADYVAGDLTVREIAEKHSVSPFTPTVIAQAAGVELRVREGGLPKVLPDPPTLPITTPGQFRQARESLGKTASQLSKDLGCSQRTVRSWEQDPIKTTWSRRPNPAAIKLVEHMIRERFPNHDRT